MKTDTKIIPPDIRRQPPGGFIKYLPVFHRNNTVLLLSVAELTPPTSDIILTAEIINLLLQIKNLIVL